jgi:hypothetical protein
MSYGHAERNLLTVRLLVQDTAQVPDQIQAIDPGMYERAVALTREFAPPDPGLRPRDDER